jgi:hypothetical protein
VASAAAAGTGTSVGTAGVSAGASSEFLQELKKKVLPASSNKKEVDFIALINFYFQI